MKRKFLKGLPENLLKSRCVSAEHTSLTTLLREVKAMESSLQAFQNYKSDCAKRPCYIPEFGTLILIFLLIYDYDFILYHMITYLCSRT